jgi:sortase (surface protein transpeptidase)
MHLTLLPRWLRIAPILVLVAVGVAASATPVPVSAAASRFPPGVPGWVPQSKPAQVIQKTAASLPSGAIGRLSIRAIGVDAVARPVGMLPSGVMDVTPNIWEVGVFNQAVAPGQPGSAVLEGHLDWTTGPAVFWNLHKLGNGDEIDYTDIKGHTFRFAVSNARNVPYNAGIPGDLYTRSGPPTITLITCSGTWLSSAHSYSTRLLLTATAI